MLDKPTFLYERAMGQKIHFKQLVYGKLALDNKKKKQEEKIKKDYSNWSMEHNGEKKWNIWRWRGGSSLSMTL